MRRNDMKSDAVLEIIREITEWKTFEDTDKVYIIQSFLLGWTDAERVHELTETDKEREEYKTSNAFSRV